MRDFVWRNRNAFMLVFLLAAFLGVLFTNEPISARPIEGRFVRLTMQPSKGPPQIWVYVDLPAGKTTAVEAWSEWQAPPVGGVVHLEELTLLWFGKSYRLPLIPPANVGGDGAT
ncbi:MAG TPA: hypothetical protein VL101_06900 [Nordella sp.]|nr:hypothetical protein [Nordella sp.]